MNTTGLLRILFKWKWMGILTFCAALPCLLFVTSQLPLKYEAQVIIERKPTKVSPTVTEKEFDVTRLTSETQRSIALLESRYLMERWLSTLDLKVDDPIENERAIKKLESSLSIRPYNYTDLLEITVKADSPEEAKKRATLLTSLFTEWDKTQGQKETNDLIQLLKDRLSKLKTELASERRKLKSYKTSSRLNLSGSYEEEEIKAEILAKERLYDTLTLELERAERGIAEESAYRSKLIAEAIASGKPIYSRKLLTIVAIFMSLFSSLMMITLLEWQDPMIQRAGDIFREGTKKPIVVIPKVKKDDSAYLHLRNSMGALVEAMSKVYNAKGSVVVQIASPGYGDGKTTLCHVLARAAKGFGAKTCILNVNPTRVEVAVGAQKGNGSKTQGETVSIDKDLEIPVEKQIERLKLAYNAIFLDMNLEADVMAASNLTSQADITGIVVTSGHTPRKLLRVIEKQVSRFPDQKSFYLLNRTVDPLPKWLRG